MSALTAGLVSVAEAAPTPAAARLAVTGAILLRLVIDAAAWVALTDTMRYALLAEAERLADDWALAHYAGPVLIDPPQGTPDPSIFLEEDYHG